MSRGVLPQRDAMRTVIAAVSPMIPPPCIDGQPSRSRSFLMIPLLVQLCGSSGSLVLHLTATPRPSSPTHFVSLTTSLCLSLFILNFVDLSTPLPGRDLVHH